MTRADVLLLMACIGWAYFMAVLAVELWRELQRAIRGWRVRRMVRDLEDEEDPLAERF